MDNETVERKIDYAHGTETVGGLLKKLGFLKGIIRKSTYLPICEYILFRDGRMHVTDLQTTLSTDTTIQGEFLVPFSKLQGIVSKLEKGSIMSFSVNHKFFEGRDKNKPEQECKVQLSLVGNGGSFTINSRPTEDFPKIPTVVRAMGKLCKDDVDTIIQATNFCSQDELRPSMTGVFLQCDRAVATDGAAMYYPKLKEVNELPVGIIIPQKSVRLLKSLNAKDGVAMTINQNGTNIEFSDGVYSVLTRTIDERFPNYENVIPQYSVFSLFVEKDELTRLVNLAMMAAHKKYNMVQFVYEDDKSCSVVSSDADEGMSFKQKLECSYIGEPVTFALNGSLLLRAIKAIHGSTVEIRGIKANTAFLIGDEDEMHYLQMPVMPY